MDDIIKKLEEVLQEAVRLYEENGRPDYEAGRIDGIKWCIEKLKD